MDGFGGCEKFGERYGKIWGRKGEREGFEDGFSDEKMGDVVVGTDCGMVGEGGWGKRHLNGLVVEFIKLVRTNFRMSCVQNARKIECQGSQVSRVTNERIKGRRFGRK